MNRSGHILILLLMFPRIFMLHAQDPGEIDWQYDIDLLGKELAREHPDLFFRIDSATFYSALGEVADCARTCSLFGISLRLQQVLAMTGDAGTAINYHFNITSEAILPLECFWFEEGIYVLETIEPYSGILGKRLVSVNEVPISRVIDSLSTLLVRQNQSYIRAQTARMIPWAQVLQYFGFAGPGGLTMGFEDGDGKVRRIFFQLPVQDGLPVTVTPAGILTGWEERKRYFRDRYFAGEKLYYIQYNHCWSREVEAEYGSGAGALFMPSFREFEKQVFRNIRKKEIEKLVIDLRFNEGGIASQGSAFINKLSRTGFNGEGKVFVITGRNTASAGVIHTLELARLTGAVIVGEPTGGRPNHFGEVHRFVLPESGLVVDCPGRFFHLVEGDPPSIRPDIEVPVSFNDYMKGVDAFLEAVIHYGE
jgi:hypothetical protein